jgi:4-carboxymuconolactone decarboxylase
MTTTAELNKRMQDFSRFLPHQSPVPSISADFFRLQQPMMWGGIWQVPGLDVRLRSFATMTAQCVNGYDFGLQHQLTVGLTTGITPRQIKGMIIQLLDYIGVPATVFAMRQAQKVIDGNPDWKAEDVPLDDVDWLESVEEMHERGREIRLRNWGEKANREIEGSLARQMVPEASNLVDGFNFGEVWARSDLSAKERMVCILAALMCRGHMKQLKQHIGYALDTGLNKKEICEVFSQAGWYRGWPCVEDALEEAQAVFAERGV